MIHLKSVRLEMINKELTGYPYNLPIIRNFDDIQFNNPVTILVGENGTGKSTLLESIFSCTIFSYQNSNGENGTGKSTLLESIASSVGSITIGGENVETELSRELIGNLK